MNFIKPIVGQWYRGGTDELFEIVAIDDQDQTIEIQFFDGSVTEIDFDTWNEQLRDELLETAGAPEDWSGAVDVEVLALGAGGLAFRQFIQGPFQNPQQYQPGHRGYAGDDEEFRPTHRRCHDAGDGTGDVSRQCGHR